MGRPIATDYMLANKIRTGVLDPSGLKLGFEQDGNRIYCFVDAAAVNGRSGVVIPGVTLAVIDDLAHATVATILRRVGHTTETKLRFLKPLYAAERFRADGTILRDAGNLCAVQIRLINKKEQLCVEGEVDVFLLVNDQVKRMTPDGNVPQDLRKYLP